MYSIIWFDPNFKEGRLRMVHGRSTLGKAHSDAHVVVQEYGDRSDLVYEVALTSELDLMDRTFRNAWDHDTSPAPEKIKINLPKAQAMAHGWRQTKRAKEFAPHDIDATIPAKAAAAETARQEIRDRYAVIQIDIDGAADATALKAIVVAAGVLPA
jgi:hypothetical protein